MNGKDVLQDINGKEISRTKVALYSENRNNCIEREKVGTVSGTSTVVMKCIMSDNKYEYQDVYGHLIESNKITFSH